MRSSRNKAIDNITFWNNRVHHYATQMVMDLRENYGIFCSIVVYPVIPKGDIIYRLIPTASHSFEEVDITLEAFEQTKKKLDAGMYKAADIPDMAEVGAL